MCGFFPKKTHRSQHAVQCKEGGDALASKIDIFDTVMYLIYLYIHVIIVVYLDIFRYLINPHDICPH